MDNTDIVNPDRTWIINFDTVWPEKDENRTVIAFSEEMQVNRFFIFITTKVTSIRFISSKTRFDLIIGMIWLNDDSHQWNYTNNINTIRFKSAFLKLSHTRITLFKRFCQNDFFNLVGNHFSGHCRRWGELDRYN